MFFMNDIELFNLPGGVTDAEISYRFSKVIKETKMALRETESLLRYPKSY